MMKAKNKTPLVRIVRRQDVSRTKRYLAMFLCFVGALLLSTLFLYAVGQKNPLEAWQYIVQGTIGYTRSGDFNFIKFYQFLQSFVVLLAIALALSPAYRMRFWNIGAQGQILIGGLVTSAIMIYGTSLPSAVIILFSILASILAAGIWGLIPAFFKAKFNTNETLFTLMLNYIAVLLVTLVCNIWKGAHSQMPIINQGTQLGWLPTILGETSILPAILVAILVITTFCYIRFTKHGYEVQVVGESVQTARYVGINVSKVIMRTVFLSAALCGLVGFFYVSNFDHMITPTTGGSYGFTAIIVCWLANFSPFLMIPYSALVAFLERGATNLSNSGFAENLNEYSSQFILFVIILAILIGKFFSQYAFVFRTNANRLRKCLLKGLLKGE